MLGFGLNASDDCVDLASKVINTVDTPDEAGGESDGVVRVPFFLFLFLCSFLVSLLRYLSFDFGAPLISPHNLLCPRRSILRRDLDHISPDPPVPPRAHTLLLQITADELLAYLVSVQPSAANVEAMVEKLFALIDDDNSGAISSGELHSFLVKKVSDFIYRYILCESC